MALQKSPHTRRAEGERGAALVEFGIIAPILLTLVFAIFEFGIAFGTQLDVRNGASEGARLVAVNFTDTNSTGSTQTTEIVNTTCGRMALASTSTITIAFAGGTGVGDTATITVEQPYAGISGFFDPIFQNTVLHSEVQTRLEQDATMDAVTQQACP
jgi:Flp pilus assembly protein TadG